MPVTPARFQVLDQVVRNSGNMDVRAAGGHDHVIADGGFAVKIDGDAVLGFHVFQPREDDAERLLGTGV